MQYKAPKAGTGHVGAACKAYSFPSFNFALTTLFSGELTHIEMTQDHKNPQTWRVPHKSPVLFLRLCYLNLGCHTMIQRGQVKDFLSKISFDLQDRTQPLLGLVGFVERFPCLDRPAKWFLSMASFLPEDLLDG